METSFLSIKQKDVVNVKDGKKLGRTTDIVFTFPEGKVMGIIVPGCKGFSFSKNELFIDLRNIIKIGEDTVLVEIASSPKPIKGGKRQSCDICEPPPKEKRNYEEYE